MQCQSKSLVRICYDCLQLSGFGDSGNPATGRTKNKEDADGQQVTHEGPCPHELGVLKLIWFTTGKKSAVPSGTKTMLRTTVPPLKESAKNHIEPRCPTRAFSPVPSS